jgi:hypothetical protein
LKHFASPKFWAAYRDLPEAIRTIADKNYQLLRENPRHPSLQLKRVGNYWSVRVGLDYRALAAEAEDGFVWFWIGPHDEYNKIIGKQ